ncbi:MAG TPA: peptide chain release factor N(5)-glutamine methyltransferase [Pyrinomonadaceae bacterium]|nr:peptide chain release factor N(5)-glutamine methyltransferase [Pyrinomonadaceae bacterium]
MPAISEKLREVEEILAAGGVADPRKEAASLMAFALKKNRTFLIAHPEYELSISEEDALAKIVTRRAAREPLQYITGVQEFYGLEFEVTPDVLIPRPETEMVVEAAIDALAAVKDPGFCEVGVGSGCIAESILHNVIAATAIGLDVSLAAIAVARRNAERLGVAGRIEFRESDVFGSLGRERFELIASNPPYVPGEDVDGLQEEVRDFEPHVALTDGNDGLSIIRRIVTGSPQFLTAGGVLLVEIGFNQSRAVEGMFDRGIWKTLEFLPDLQGIPRLVRAKLR